MKELAARISGAELDVLEVLWQAEGPMPIADVRGALEQSHSWDSSTVKTLLRRLCEKKAVEAEKRVPLRGAPHRGDGAAGPAAAGEDLPDRGLLSLAAGADAAAVPLGALPHPDGPGGLLRCGGGDSGFRISCAGGRRG